MALPASPPSIAHHAFAKLVAADRGAASRLLEEIWRNAAKRYARLPADRVFFELLNEPGEKIAWTELAECLAGVARAEPPDHTLVLGPPGTRRIDALEATEAGIRSDRQPVSPRRRRSARLRRCGRPRASA
jgi:hypothetical protein